MLICPKCRTIYSSTALASCYRDGERLVDYDRFVANDRDPLRGVLIAGKYRLVERVGQGGMGMVYRAVQVGLNRSVAVKILKRELNVDPDTVARFHREANAMSLLTHPNTVRVYDFGQTDDGLLYLCMELLEGELITERMAREGPLEVIEAIRVTQQILRSLAEAHKNAIVHRDLKPDNVFVARVGGHEEPVVKVLDFGIAKVVAPDRQVDQFETQAGTVFGTPRYMSPEQAQGATLDGRSDLYSVGTLLYQMLVGHAPFTDDDAVVVMAKHIRETPVPPVIAAPSRPIPKSLNDVVVKALAKDPGGRFQEASEFEMALEACVPDIGTAQAAALTGGWTERTSRRLPALYGLCALALFGAGYFGVRVYAKLHTPEREHFTSVPLQTVEPVAPPAPKLEVPAEEPIPVTEAVVQAEPHVEPVPRVSESALVDVAIQSQPTGAVVYRGGKRVGATPLKLRLREHEEFVRVELRLSGYQPLAAELAAKDGTRVLALTPVKAPPARNKRGRRHADDGRRTRKSDAPRRIESAPKSPTTSPSTPVGGPYERFE